MQYLVSSLCLIIIRGRVNVRVSNSSSLEEQQSKIHSGFSKSLKKTKFRELYHLYYMHLIPIWQQLIFTLQLLYEQNHILSISYQRTIFSCLAYYSGCLICKSRVVIFTDLRDQMHTKYIPTPRYLVAQSYHKYIPTYVSSQYQFFSVWHL